MKKDAAAILFLKEGPKNQKPYYGAVDSWLSIQDPNPTLAQRIKRIVNASADTTVLPQRSTLEGTLRIHPKYLLKYYIEEFTGGQRCALFGDEALKGIEPGSRIEVKGLLGTRFHPGTTKSNLSPFPRTWFIYMDVESVTVLRQPEPKPSP